MGTGFLLLETSVRDEAGQQLGDIARSFNSQATDLGQSVQED